MSQPSLAPASGAAATLLATQNVCTLHLRHPSKLFRLSAATANPQQQQRLRPHSASGPQTRHAAHSTRSTQHTHRGGLGVAGGLSVERHAVGQRRDGRDHDVEVRQREGTLLVEGLDVRPRALPRGRVAADALREGRELVHGVEGARRGRVGGPVPALERPDEPQGLEDG